jgi:pimeloyl-ACP methyl ester carboxylesterase
MLTIPQSRSSASRRAALAMQMALASVLLAHPTSARADDCGSGGPVARDVYLDGVEMRPGVQADIHLRVLGDGNDDCGTILAVHGAASNGNSLTGFGAAILAAGDPQDGERVCRFIAMDLPGHGLSSPPTGALLGELGYSDYVAAVVGTLDRLQDRGVQVATLMGHSLGGAVVSLIQQRLVDQGTSLRAAYGVEHVVLLAPGLWPGDSSCALCQNQQIGAVLGQFEVNDPALGLVAEIPPAVFLALVWSKPDGTIATNAPTPAELAVSGIISVESVTALMDALGTPVHPRVNIAPGIFAPDVGTRLDIVSFQQDTLVLPSENEALYQYATGESPSHGWMTVDGANAVHGDPVSDPGGLLAAISGFVKWP